MRGARRRRALAALAATGTIGGTIIGAAACARTQGDAARDSAGATTAARADADPTHAVAGAAGIPAGYQGRTDAGEPATAAGYTTADGAWEIRTGPAHVTWAAKDSARGTYEAHARFEQLEAPRHPEAFGLVVGGRDLEGPGRTYTYFVVRGTGEYLVRVREGDATRDVRGWTAAPAVARAGTDGRATYDLAVRVAADSTRFLVGGTPVFAVAKGAVPTDGIAGIRVNHNLHVRVTPVEIR